MTADVYFLLHVMIAAEVMLKRLKGKETSFLLKFYPLKCDCGGVWEHLQNLTCFLYF